MRLTPEGVYLTGIKQTDGVVLVTGLAQTNERVSEFLRNAQTNSPWLDRMELVEIKAVNLPPAARAGGGGSRPIGDIRRPAGTALMQAQDCFTAEDAGSAEFRRGKNSLHHDASAFFAPLR